MVEGTSGGHAIRASKPPTQPNTQAREKLRENHSVTNAHCIRNFHYDHMHNTKRPFPVNKFNLIYPISFFLNTLKNKLQKNISI